MFPHIDWLTLLTLILATNFSPGPVTITSLSLGILYGFKNAFKFTSGVFIGYTLLILFTAFAARTLLAIFPGFDIVIRVAGAVYIGWLAISTLRKNLQIDVQDQPALGFKQGILIQFVNVKGMLFGLTLFSSLLAPLQEKIIWQVLGAVGVGISGFMATTLYASFGSLIQRFTSNERFRKYVSLFLSMALFYVALSIAGFWDWLGIILR